MPTMSRAWSRGLHGTKPTTEHGKPRKTTQKEDKPMPTPRCNSSRRLVVKYSKCIDCGVVVDYYFSVKLRCGPCKAKSDKARREANRDRYNTIRNTRRAVSIALKKEIETAPAPQAQPGFCQRCIVVRAAQGKVLCYDCLEEITGQL